MDEWDRLIPRLTSMCQEKSLICRISKERTRHYLENYNLHHKKYEVCRIISNNLFKCTWTNENALVYLASRELKQYNATSNY